MVSTLLKNMSQIGNHSQIGVKIKKWKKLGIIPPNRGEQKQIFEIKPPRNTRVFFWNTCRGVDALFLATSLAHVFFLPPSPQPSGPHKPATRAEVGPRKNGGIDELHNQLRDRIMMQMLQNAPFNHLTGTTTFLEKNHSLMFFFPDMLSSWGLFYWTWSYILFEWQQTSM